MDREPGLSEAAAGVVPLDECVRQTSIENLSVLPSGFIPHNPSELLGGKRMKEIIGRLSAQYDMLIIDSPPMAVVTDALLLSPEVDGTLLVVGAKLGNRRVLQTSLSKLARTSAFIVGAVLNGFDPLRMYTSYGYYTYRYYYYYYSEGSGKKRGRRNR
jgi:capsular exopolysaccharide synthesis family protein